MNTLQILKQVRNRLRARVWDVVGGAVVFGSVHVSQAPTAEAVDGFRFPIALIRPGSEASNPQIPASITFVVEVEIVVAVAGDQLGEHALIGASRAGGATNSEGRGLFEVEEQVKNTLGQMQTAEGIRIVGFSAGADRAGVVGDDLYVAARTLTFTLTGTADPYYHPVQRAAAVDAAGAGDADLTWADPPDRFDRRVIRIRRAAGATAPATVTDGTQVTDAAIGDLAFTDSPGAGQFSYAFFAAYTDTGQAVNEKFSDQEPGTVATVTVT